MYGLLYYKTKYPNRYKKLEQLTIKNKFLDVNSSTNEKNQYGNDNTKQEIVDFQSEWNKKKKVELHN